MIAPIYIQIYIYIYIIIIIIIFIIIIINLLSGANILTINAFALLVTFSGQIELWFDFQQKGLTSGRRSSKKLLQTYIPTHKQTRLSNGLLIFLRQLSEPE